MTIPAWFAIVKWIAFAMIAAEEKNVGLDQHRPDARRSDSKFADSWGSSPASASNWGSTRPG